jgi:anti-anti-sigma regulatory factor
MLAIWSLSTVAAVDLAGAEMLVHLREQLGARGVRLRLADVRGPVRESLRRAGLEAHFGPIEANMAIARIVRDERAAP